MKPPDASPPDSTPHELIDAEMVVDGIKTPADEKALSTALSSLAGIRDLTIAEGKVSVEYDPVEVSKARLTEVITRSGYRVVDVESAPASALSDALHPEKS
jgi:copper chaperone CopZ